MEIKQQLQIDLASKSSLTKFSTGVFAMDGFKRSKSPLGRCLESRQWGSETDLHQSSLPPISSNEKKNSNFKWIPNNSGKQLLPNRPPTPSPGRQQDSVFSFGKTSRISPSNSSSQRLSLNLDFIRPIVGGTDFRRHSASFADHSPELEWSPRICVRSLPSSPRVQRSHRLHHRNLRRLSSDSEQGDVKDERIINWIRDVSENNQAHTSSFNDDDDEDFLLDCSLDKNDEMSFNCVNGLPVIQEGRKT